MNLIEVSTKELLEELKDRGVNLVNPESEFTPCDSEGFKSNEGNGAQVAVKAEKLETKELHPYQIIINVMNMLHSDLEYFYKEKGYISLTLFENELNMICQLANAFKGL